MVVTNPTTWHEGRYTCDSIIYSTASVRADIVRIHLILLTWVINFELQEWYIYEKLYPCHDVFISYCCQSARSLSGRVEVSRSCRSFVCK